MMNLEEDILDIQNRLKKNEYPNEASISQGIVLRLLKSLQWPTYDTQAVHPEYPIQGTRVDFALRIPQQSNPVIFIEVKQPGKGLGADKQLFQYAFHIGVPLAIFTDGKEWHFYLPSGMGNYDERRFYKLDLVERDKQESLYRLKRYLAYEQVTNGKALEYAKEDYENVSKERQAEKNIPKAWNKLIEEENGTLIEAISEKVESICGFKPTQNQILKYLSTLNKPVNIPYLPSPGVKSGDTTSSVPSEVTRDNRKHHRFRQLTKATSSVPSEVTRDNRKHHRFRQLTKATSSVPSEVTRDKVKLKVTFPDGVEINHRAATQTMVEVIKKIGCEKVKKLGIMVTRHKSLIIMSDNPLAAKKKNWTDMGSGYSIFTNSNTEDKFKQLNEINKRLALRLKIEKV